MGHVPTCMGMVESSTNNGDVSARGMVNIMLKQTIYAALTLKLGRIPTNEELKADVQRIKQDALVEVASKGKLPFQRRRK